MEKSVSSTMFYLTLPSNSSADAFHKKNTQSEFKTQLPEPIDLQGDWEVGLAEIQYPSSWYNLPCDQFVRIGTLDIEIEEGYYHSFQDLFECINKQIKKKLNTKPGASVRFEYLPSKKVMVRNNENVTVTLSKAFGEMMGFQRFYNALIRFFYISETVKSDFTADINQGKHHLYVYSDIVEPHVVGDVKVRLVRIVPVEKGDIVTKQYENIQYFPVMIKKFNTIEINIKDDMNTPIAFNHGKTIVTLHFRKV